MSLKNTIAKETQSRTSKRQRGKLEHNMAMNRKSCDEKMGMQRKATKGGKARTQNSYAILRARYAATVEHKKKSPNDLPMSLGWAQTRS